MWSRGGRGLDMRQIHKFLGTKMGKLVLLSAFAAISLLFAIAAAVNLPNEDSTSYISTGTLNFKTKTVAICDYYESYVYCHDELMVNCGDEEYVLPKTEEIARCGGIELKVPRVTASAVFDKDWKDPRILA